MPRTATRKLPSTYHHGDLREALIEAALIDVEKNGHEGISFSALARTLGVSQAAPYRHFVDREELLAAVGTRGFMAFSAAQRESLAGGRGSQLGRLARAYLDFGQKRPGLYHLMYVSGILPRAELDSPLKLAAKECFDLVLVTLPPELDEAARLRFGLKIWAAVHGILTLVEQGLFHPENHNIPVAEVVDELVHDTELAIAAAIADGKRG